MRIRQVVDTFAARLRARWNDDVEAICLFGSYARGDAGEDSDIDLLVLVRRAEPTIKRDALDIGGELWAETGFLVSPSVIDRDRYDTWRLQERPLVMAIEREGIAL